MQDALCFLHVANSDCVDAGRNRRRGARRSLPPKAWAVEVSSLVEERAEHPGRLFVNRHALRREIGGRLVARFIGHRKEAASRSGSRLVSVDQNLDHRLGSGGSFGRVSERAQLRKLRI